MSRRTSWIDKLERKLGKFAVPHLILYVIGIYAFGTILNFLIPGVYSQYLCLDVSAILHGQVWRLVTFLAMPFGDVIYLLIGCYFYYWIGTSLEASWGSFRFNLYYVTGVLALIISAFIAYLITGVSFPLTTTYLNLSLFLAFASLFPDAKVLLFFILPIKVKWLAYIDGIIFVRSILRMLIPSAVLGRILGSAYQPVSKMYYINDGLSALAPLVVFLIFFLSSRNLAPYTPKEIKRKRDYRKNFTVVKEQGAPTYRHRCTVCGRTDVSNPELEFRYCSKCSGMHEYCMDHLYTHVHITGQDR